MLSLALILTSIPASFASLKQLKVLTLNSNQLTGPIESFLGELLLLETLQLDTNSFVGTIPASFASLQLQVLTMENNHLSGTLLPNLSKNLRTLTLDSNSFVGSYVKIYSLADTFSLLSSVYAVTDMRVLPSSVALLSLTFLSFHSTPPVS